jgi:integrase
MMATLFKDGPGQFRVLFVDADRKRKTIRLSKVNDDFAATFKTMVETLMVRRRSPLAPTVESKLNSWWIELDGSFQKKLVRAGLVESVEAPPAPTVHQLGAFLEQFIEGLRTERRPFTIANLDQCRKRLIAFFGADRDIATILPIDATNWRKSLFTLKYAKATIGRTVRRAKQMFKEAVTLGLIDKSPFEHLQGAEAVNKKRKVMIEAEIVDRVIDATADIEMRLIIALSRYAGLRCPSEHLALRWADVLWDQDKMWVRSSKTDSDRLIPIFPKLRPYLDAAWDALGDSPAEYVINKSRDPGVNWRQQLLRLVHQAGEKPWPKLFHSLRASFVTELAQEWPIHVFTEWTGHTPAVALLHYTKATDDDFAKATCAARHRKRHSKDQNNPARASNENENCMNVQEFANDAEMCLIGECPAQDSNLKPAD